MLAILWPAVSRPPVITPEMAYAAALRNWGSHDAKRLAAAIAWERYGEDDARAELATTLAYHAQKARMLTVSCQALAADMLEEAMDALDERHNAVLQRMTDAAEPVLRANPRDRLAAALAAADIARTENVPPDLIDAAMRFASWRTRRRA